MTKVWVPIDLPEGGVVEYVTVRDVRAHGNRIFLSPVGTVTADEPMPQHALWECRVTRLLIEDSVEQAEATCNALGKTGWDCFHVKPGVVWKPGEVWFKRRQRQ